jgi:aminopeptidase YwaD
MSLIDLAQKIATPDQRARRQALLEYLPVFIHRRQRFSENGHELYPENIIVPAQRDEPVLVLGAHYDSVPGSPGANDNAAAVAILLHLLRSNYGFNTPLEFAFFDMEEAHLVGSRTYAGSTNKQHIKAMINLDVCGVGDTLLVAAGPHALGTPFQVAAQRAVEDAGFPAQMIAMLPPSDDLAFEQHHIPTLSICIVPRVDVPLMAGFAGAMHSQSTPVQLPSVIDTMHNRSRDTVDVLDENAMWNVTHFVLSLIGHIKTLTRS